MDSVHFDQYCLVAGSSSPTPLEGKSLPAQTPLPSLIPSCRRKPDLRARDGPRGAMAMRFRVWRSRRGWGARMRLRLWRESVAARHNPSSRFPSPRGGAAGGVGCAWLVGWIGAGNLLFGVRCSMFGVWCSVMLSAISRLRWRSDPQFADRSSQLKHPSPRPSPHAVNGKCEAGMGRGRSGLRVVGWMDWIDRML
jgi:hypothetical protein